MAYRSCRVNNHDLQLFTDSLEGKSLRSLFQGSWEGSALTSQVWELKQQSKHPSLGQLSTGGSTYNWEDHKCFEKSHWCYRQSINQAGVSLTESKWGACVCVEEGSLLQVVHFCWNRFSRKGFFFLGAYKVWNLHVSKLMTLGRGSHVLQIKSEQRTIWNRVLFYITQLICCGIGLWKTIFFF